MNNTARLLQHNAWATRVLLERCRSLTPQQLQQRFDIGPGSLHDTLRHIIGAMLRWSDRIADQPVRASIEKNPDPQTPDELLVLLDRAGRELEEVGSRRPARRDDAGGIPARALHARHRDGACAHARHTPPRAGPQHVQTPGGDGSPRPRRHRVGASHKLAPASSGSVIPDTRTHESTAGRHGPEDRSDPLRF